MFENIMIFEDLDRGKKINVTKLFPQKMILQTPKNHLFSYISNESS